LSALREALRSVRDQPLHSLASRIVALVTIATLLTALVVTSMSARAIRGVLRERVERRFPALLQSAAERVEIWYAQRELDIDTFARSSALAESLTRFAGNDRAAHLRAAEDTRSYLSYLLERFPQYDTLVVTDDEARPLATIGLDPPASLAWPSRVSLPGHVEQVGPHGNVVQVVSAPVHGTGKIPIGALHAVVRRRELDQVLRSDWLSASGRIFLLGSRGEPLAATGGGSSPAAGLALPEPGEPVSIVETLTEDGRKVLRSGLRSERLGWVLVVEESVDDLRAGDLAVVRQVLGFNLAAVVFFSALAFAIALSIVRPIQALSHAARCIAEGDIDVDIPETRSAGELRLLTRTFNRMASRLRKNRIELHESRAKVEQANSRLRAQNEELQRLNEALELLSITDGLTRLYNHRYFQEQLSREIARCERSGDPLALILLDIDNFKQLNDAHGHAAGDTVLREVARTLSTLIREGDVLARYGGEEFALIPSRTTAEGAFGLAEKLRLAVSGAKIEVETDAGPRVLHVTLSAGIATYRGNRKAFFIDADRALYRAKAAGKDCVVIE
jgi:diguanylate cyclase (GGDEF)-like protein